MQKKLLELFSGSKTVSRVFEQNGYSSFSVDNNPALHPSMCCDILNVQPSSISFWPDFIWASPDCSKLSRQAPSHHWHKKTLKYRVYEYTPLTNEALKSFALVEKTVEIIKAFNDAFFIIENPIGRIQHLAPLKSLGHYRYAVNYADFGFHYSKETYLFTNMWLPFSTKKVHSDKPGLLTVNGSYKRSIVPPTLVQSIIDSI